MIFDFRNTIEQIQSVGHQKIVEGQMKTKIEPVCRNCMFSMNLY
jgi:hypothetical protein